MARGCIFCGGSPVTREHLWPDWARRLLAEDDPLPHHHLVDREGKARVDRQWRQQPYSMKVRAVCAQCNSGWMSVLESQAQTLMMPMLQGRGRALHKEGQRTLAAWALKTALMFEHAQDPKRRVVPHAEYPHLHQHGEPSAELRIWMAAYVGDLVGYAHAYGADAETTQRDDRGTRDIYGSTVTLGGLVFQVFGSNAESLTAGLRMDAQAPVHQLWPYEGSFVWTPRPGFNDAALLRFSEAIIAALMHHVARREEHAA